MKTDGEALPAHFLWISERASRHCHPSRTAWRLSSDDRAAHRGQRMRRREGWEKMERQCAHRNARKPEITRLNPLPLIANTCNVIATSSCPSGRIHSSAGLQRRIERTRGRYFISVLFGTLPGFSKLTEGGIEKVTAKPFLCMFYFVQCSKKVTAQEASRFESLTIQS